MENKTCANCRQLVDEWNESCKKCGFTLVLEPDEKSQARYLRGPSLGALLFTQAWCVGARLYIWFLFSLIPIAGIAVLIIMVLFGRRLSWKYGGWQSFEEYKTRMRNLDILGAVWVILLIAVYFVARQA
ncbi:MAG: hypothetical protein ACD_76C00039G0008 [uncultured bacterium]|nr:MAG: hypothetical protein ACD_76C00039G0008 [uncultured bacterium]HBD05778.1 hypothetical protein [Candidatus Uhrbacteria bacterium]